MTGCEQTPEQLKERLNDYHELQALMDTFFREVNFCVPNCITKNSRYRFFDSYNDKLLGKNRILPGYLACCASDYRIWDTYMDRFKGHIEEKIEILELNKDETRGDLRLCSAHNREKGCLLGKNKPPVCVGYVCDDFIRFLKERYNLDYDKEKMVEFLKDTLDFKVTNEEISVVKGLVSEHIKVVQNKNKRLKENP